MNVEKEHFEEVLEQVLAFQEEGETREEILALMSEEKNEVMEIFALTAELGKIKEKIVPPRALLEKIVAKTEPVTTGAEQRYNKQGVGRLSLNNILINKNFNLMNWKIIAPIGIITIVLAVFALTQPLPGENKAIQKIAKYAVNPATQTKDIASVPEVGAETESIDSIIDSFLDDSSSEQVAVAEEDANVSLLADDSQEIDNFSQSYDEKEF
jgi:hypothetical protein